MMLFEVESVKRNCYLVLNEDWNWNDEKGRIVAIKSLDMNQFEDYDNMFLKLEELLVGEQIDLRNPLNLSTGCLYCDVFLQGENLIEFLREG